MALFFSNKATNDRNRLLYDRQPGEEYVLRPTNAIEVMKKTVVQSTNDKGGVVQRITYYYRTLFGHEAQDAYQTYGNRLKFPFVDDVKLKIGVRVRSTRNIYGHGRTLLIANGNTGTVTSILEGCVSVMLDHTNLVVYIPQVRSMRTQSFKTWDDGQSIRCVSYYVPLRLCYASTIHQSQGASISGPLDLDPKGMTKSAENGPWLTAPGLAYTAVSRATDIKNIKFLKMPTPEMFVCDPKVKAYLKKALETEALERK